MSAEDHGPTCADSPIDHYCGEAHRGVTESDQGTTWREAAMNTSLRFQSIAGMHEKIINEDGSTDGTCAECSHPHPCPTYHLAVGWNPDEDEEGWCPHAAVKI